MPATRPRRQRVSRSLVRHIGAEILKTSVFVLVVLELSYSLLIAVAVARNYDLDLPLALPVMWFTALSMLNDSVPLSLLFGTSLVYGRFIADREVMAHKSFGMSYGQILAPAIVLAVLFTAGGYLINAYLVPEMKHQRRNIAGLLVDQFRSLGKGYNRDFRFGNLNLWIMHHDGRRLEGVFLAPRLDREEDDVFGAEKLTDLDVVSYPYCVYAQKGRVIFPGELEHEPSPPVEDHSFHETLRSFGFDATEREESEPSDAQIYIELEGISLFWTDELHPGGTSAFFQRARIGKISVPFDPAGSKKRRRGRKEMVTPRLAEEIRAIEKRLSGGELDAKGEKAIRASVARMRTEYHERWARMAAYFLFPVLAGLIALLLNSPNRLLPFFVSASAIPTFYYSSTTLGRMLGHSGGPAWLVLQLGNILLVVVAAIGLWFLDKRLLR